MTQTLILSQLYSGRQKKLFVFTGPEKPRPAGLLPQSPIHAPPAMKPTIARRAVALLACYLLVSPSAEHAAIWVRTRGEALGFRSRHMPMHARALGP